MAQEQWEQPQGYGPVLSGPVVARAWRDAAFRQRLLAEPAAALREAGVQVPEGLQVRVVENAADLVHLILPAKPSGDMTDEQLEQIAAAGGLPGGVVASGGVRGY
jgi:hypothetical protein